MKLIDTRPAHRIDILRGNSYFTDLPESILQEIAAHMHLREYTRGDVLFWEADLCDGLHIIETGSAKIYRLSPQGRQYIVRILQEGDTFAEVPAFDGGTNPVNVEALETCQVGFGAAKELEWSDISRGMSKDVNSTTDELQMRTWWRRWNELMTGEQLPPEVKAPLEETFTAPRAEQPLTASASG